MKAILSSILLLFGCYLSGQQTSFTIEVSNIKNSEGSIFISVFKDQQGFEDEAPVKKVKFSKKGKVEGDVLTVELSLPPGDYGLALFDDENNDGEMNYNWVGMPEEGFGFSNYYHSGLSRPEFLDFSFHLNENTEIVKAKMRYL